MSISDNVTVSAADRGYLKTGNHFTDRRARELIDSVAARRFHTELFRWAAVDEGPLRTRLGHRIDIACELEVLCEALGPWAHVASREFFGDRIEDGQYGTGAID